MLSARAAQLNVDGYSHTAKTPALRAKHRAENAYQGTVTIQSVKSKGGVMRTPFHPKTAQPQRLLKDVSGSTTNKVPIHLVSRSNKPLTDKTPFKNRILNVYDTPAPDQKFSKFNLSNPTASQRQGATPASEPGSARASSARRHVRAPKANVGFQTPATRGNHWDVSDTDIVIPEMEQVLEIEEELDYLDYLDEIEYSPPNTLDLPYHPPFDFDLPNYTLLGQAALQSVYSYANDEWSPPSFDFKFSDQDLMKWDSFSLPSLSLDDDSPARILAGTSAKPSTTTVKPTPPTPMSSTLASSTHISSRLATTAPTRRTATSLVKTLAAKSRPVSASTTTRATSAARSSNATSRIIPSTTQKSAASKASVTTRTARTPATRSAATSSAAKPNTDVAVEPTTSRSDIAKPLTSRPVTCRPATAVTTHIRPTTSSLARSAPLSARAGAVKPTAVSTSAGSVSNKSAVPASRTRGPVNAGPTTAVALTKRTAKPPVRTGIVSQSKKCERTTLHTKPAPANPSKVVGSIASAVRGDKDDVLEAATALGEVLALNTDASTRKSVGEGEAQLVKLLSAVDAGVVADRSNYAEERGGGVIKPE